jgi:hypothetical protein
MDKVQFRVLYREFLFRMVDLEVLSPQALGDSSKLFGQFAAMLISISLALTIMGFGAAGPRWMTVDQRQMVIWSNEHFLISFTMLIVGLFAVLSWDSTFPTKLDVMVLAPLPVRPKTLFLAKVTGIAVALALVVATLHCLAQATWPYSVAAQAPLVFDGHAIPLATGFLNYWRTFAAFWITLFAAGAFIFCAVLALQGLIALFLTRSWYLRASSWLQLGLFCFFICGIMTMPMKASPTSLAAAQGNGLAGWQFTFWFLGLFQELKGSPALPVLAHRAWLGLAGVIGTAAVAFVFSYFRMLRKIVEEPDILPSTRGAIWLPSFGDSLQTALGHFSVRTLLRSRQHRMIFAFYLGIGFGLTTVVFALPIHMQGGAIRMQLISGTIFTLLLSLVGARIVFAIPADLRANWIFRITPIRGGLNCLRARRRAILAIAVLPVWLAVAALLLWWWPVSLAASHLAVLGLLGAILGEICLLGFQKIPFTCSYLPGKTNIHVTLLFSVMVLLQFIGYCAYLENGILDSPWKLAGLLAALAVIWYVLRRRTNEQAESDDLGLMFEDPGTPAVQGLGL